jgi:hypothetical protein
MATEVNGELLINLKEALGSAAAIPVTGTLTEIPLTTGITTTTVRIPTQTVNTILKAADPNRVGCTIFNNSTANMYVKFGATASIGAGTESFTRQILPNGYYEVPFFYTGRIDAIWDAADATGEALITERFTGFSPLSVPSSEFWFKADQAVTNPGGATPFWGDSSGKNRNLAQATAADQPTQVAFVFNNVYPAIRFGTAPTDNWLGFVTSFTTPNIVAIYAVIKMVTTNDYQIFFHVNGSGPASYLGGDGADFARNRPALYTINGDVAVWGSDLVNGTFYVVKWSYDLSGGVTESYATQVNDGTPVTGTSPNIGPGSYISLGLNPAVAGNQDLLSDVGELVMYSAMPSAADEQLLFDYFNAKYGIF